MRILATFENSLPSTAADAEVFVNTAAALAQQPGVHVELYVTLSPGASVNDVREYYLIEGPLEIKTLPSHDPSIAMQHLRHTWLASRRTQGTDLVYTRNTAMMMLALQAGAAVAFDHYRPWGDQVPPLRPVYRYLMGHPDFLGALIHSHVASASYLKVGVPPERIRVAHNGWNPKRIGPVLSRTEARTRTELPQDRFIAVYSGRINQRKGLETLLDVARRDPETLFVLIGSEGEGAIERAARDLPNVIVRRFMPAADLGAFLYAADVLVIPPSAAPLVQHGNTVLPLKLFLYLGSGRPILGPATPDVEEVLQHRQNALLVPPGDVSAAVSALAEIRTDAQLARRLGAAARTTGEDLTWNARGARIRQYLDEWMALRRAGQRTTLGPWSPLECVTDSFRWLKWISRHGGFTMPTGPC